MRRRAAAVPFLLALVLARPAAALDGAPGDPRMREAVELYRAGNLPEALSRMADVLDRDPENAAARTYVWTIARRMREREKAASMTDAEKDAAVRQAYTLLEERRRRSRETLDKLAQAYQRTRNVRGPEDLALSAEGMDEMLGTEFESERVKAEAESYFQKIMANLTRALASSAFVTRKDHLNAQGTLAYYRGDLAAALKSWEAALAEDPSDKGLRRNVEHLRDVIEHKAREAQVREVSARAETFQRTGYLAEAGRAWEEVLALSPKDAKALENLALCRRAVRKEALARQVKELTDKGITLYQDGRSSEAVDVWLKALQADPTYEPARVWISHVGKRLEARRAPAPAPVADGQKPSSTPGDARQAQELYRQGLLLYAGNEVSKAIEVWKRSLRLDPELMQARQALRQAQAELKYVE
jgi:tetratricopeptide (TPR) repeat protein